MIDNQPKWPVSNTYAHWLYFLAHDTYDPAWKKAKYFLRVRDIKTNFYTYPWSDDQLKLRDFFLTSEGKWWFEYYCNGNLSMIYFQNSDDLFRFKLTFSEFLVA